jgi:hypothetical protein
LSRNNVGEVNNALIVCPYEAQRIWHALDAANEGPSSCCSGTPSWTSTVRYLGIEVDGALKISEQIEI